MNIPLPQNPLNNVHPIIINANNGAIAIPAAEPFILGLTNVRIDAPNVNPNHINWGLWNQILRPSSHARDVQGWLEPMHMD